MVKITALLVSLLMMNVMYAQTSASGYTPNLSLKKYAAGATGIADSLNWNWQKLDSAYKWNYDSLGVLKTDVYTFLNYSGAPQAGVVTWNSIASAAKDSLVRVSTSQTISGTKTFSSGMDFSTSAMFRLPIGIGSLQGQLARGGTSSADLLLFNYGTSTTDTIVSQRWFRANMPSVSNAVLVTGNQTIAGTKTFSYNLTFGLSGSLQLPVNNNEVSNSLFGDNTYAYYTKAGVAGNFDTLLTWNAFQSVPLKRSFIPFVNNIYDLGSASYKWNDIHTANITATNIYTSSIEPSGADTTISLAGNTKALKDASGNVLIYSGTKRTVGSSTYPMDSVVAKYVVSSDTANGLVLSAKNVAVSNFFSLDTERLDVTSGTTLGIQYSYTELNPDGAYTITTLSNLNVVAGRGGTIAILTNITSNALTFQNGTGNLWLAGSDFVMGENDVLMLIWTQGGGKWLEISRSNN